MVWKFFLLILEITKKDNLLVRELYYLDSFKPGYNVLAKAGNSLGYKHTSQFINKMKKC